jgi:hypothetical protein
MASEITLLRAAAIPDDVLALIREHARRCDRCEFHSSKGYTIGIDTRFCPVAVLMIENAATILRSVRRSTIE